MATLPETFLSNAMDLLVDTVFVMDADGRSIYVSAACERLLGFTPDELIGRTIAELVHPDDRQRTQAVAAEIMRGHPQTHFENRCLRKDGSPVDIMWSARWSEADAVRVAVARDVTSLKHAERVQSALYRISQAAHAAGDLRALLSSIQGIIAELVPANNVLAALYDASQGTVSIPYATGEQVPGRGARPLDETGPIAHVLRTGEPLLTVTDRGGFAPGTPSERGNWLGVPLISNDEVVGAIVVQTGGGEHRYDASHRELLRFVSTQVATVIERKQAESRLRHLALHDPLTDLPNRALFYDRLEVALRRAERDGERVGLLYVDIDDFKRVNDSHGHEVGDKLLQAVARRLLGCVRKSDTVARLGGDEFTVLLTNIAVADAAAKVGDKVRQAVAELYDIDGRSVTISASIGSAVYPEHGGDQDALLRHADSNMYATKPREG